jgi:hypothetical protein
VELCAHSTAPRWDHAHRGRLGNLSSNFTQIAAISAVLSAVSTVHQPWSGDDEGPVDCEEDQAVH